MGYYSIDQETFWDIYLFILGHFIYMHWSIVLVNT